MYVCSLFIQSFVDGHRVAPVNNVAMNTGTQGSVGVPSFSSFWVYVVLLYFNLNEAVNFQLFLLFGVLYVNKVSDTKCFANAGKEQEIKVETRTGR